MKGLRAGFVPLLALAIGAAGCGDGAQGGCPQLPACGGNPAGTWSVVKDACQFQPFRPAQPVDTTSFTTISPAMAMLTPPQPNPIVASQTTSGDWCSSLVYAAEMPDAVLNVALWHDAPLLTAASIALFGTDNSYVTTLQFSTAGLPVERNTTHFAPHCLQADGAPSPTCDKLTTALIAFYGTTATPSAKPNFSDIKCSGDATTTGCDCTYVYSVTVQDGGNWVVPQSAPDTLLQDSGVGQFLYNGALLPAATPATTMQTSFCAQGGTLQLSGVGGGSLFGLQGLRTMMLSQ